MKGKLNGVQRNRLRRLLNMKYKPSELAEEIGFGVKQVYMVYVHLGCPHERDIERHIWINGADFREWYLEFYGKRPLRNGEAFCRTCGDGVEMVDPITKVSKGIKYWACDCPNYGRRLVRIIERLRI